MRVKNALPCCEMGAGMSQKIRVVATERFKCSDTSPDNTRIFTIRVYVSSVLGRSSRLATGPQKPTCAEVVGPASIMSVTTSPPTNPGFLASSSLSFGCWGTHQYHDVNVNTGVASRQHPPQCFSWTAFERVRADIPQTPLAGSQVCTLRARDRRKLETVHNRSIRRDFPTSCSL